MRKLNTMQNVFTVNTESGCQITRHFILVIKSSKPEQPTLQKENLLKGQFRTKYLSLENL